MVFILSNTGVEWGVDYWLLWTRQRLQGFFQFARGYVSFPNILQLPTFQIWLTPRKTNKSLEITGWNMYFLLKSSILVRFQGCMTWEGPTKTTDRTMHGSDSAVRFPWWTWSEAQMPVLSDLTGDSQEIVRSCRFFDYWLPLSSLHAPIIRVFFVC